MFFCQQCYWREEAYILAGVEQNGAMVEDRPLGAIALDDQRIVGGIGHQAQGGSWVSAVLASKAVKNA